MSNAKIEGTAEAWETGELGRDEEHVQVSTTDLDSLDEALALQMISIRLQKQLLEDLKSIASYHGLGYQPLIKQVLRRFADGEMKRIARECMANANAKLDPEDADAGTLKDCG